MNHKHLYYMETTAFNSINHNHRSIWAGKLTHIRQTNGPNCIQAGSTDITAALNYDQNCICVNALLIWKSAWEVSSDQRVFLLVLFLAYDSRLHMQRQHALPWTITQNHLYSPPLTFHQSFYHWAISPNCVVQCNCIHYYAKKNNHSL